MIFVQGVFCKLVARTPQESIIFWALRVLICEDSQPCFLAYSING